MCGCISCDPLPGAWLATQACALSGNQTGDPLVRRPALSPLSHTSQGQCVVIEHWECDSHGRGSEF